ncbi:MAG TPA: hypothetical protein VFH58_03065 [Acidimicrobiales bacterium]|nr:hypothetical protein [Acidimicrobiales bacterium]
MDDKMMSRALNWVGGGGTVMAVSALMAAGLFAVTPDGESPVSHLSPCFSAGCTSGLTGAAAASKEKKTVDHVGRVTYPETRGVNQEVTTSAVASTTSTTAPKANPQPAVWTTALPTQHLDAPIVGMDSVKNGSLLMVGADGGVFPVGQAGFAGSLSGKALSSRVAALAADPAGGGYWLVGEDGGVFAFDARYHGSLSGKHLSSPIVAMAATRSGRGYWLVSADGGVFSFGDARYQGSLSGKHLSSPIVAMAATQSGRGYWLASADGGVFAFGDAPYRGASSGSGLPAPITSIVPTSTGRGYWLGGRNGQIQAFGDARPVVVAHPATQPATQPATIVATAVDRPAPAAQSRRPAAARRPAPAPITRGTDHYKSGSIGYDISQYQCGGFPAGQPGIGVVQVSGGAIDNAPNPCYAQEAAWAGPYMSAYIYMNGLPSPAPAASLSGPAGHCAVTNVACASYNYGYNYSRYWVEYSRSQGVDPKLFWLDVEKYSGWQDTISNQLVIRGALNGLRTMHVLSGIYSSSAQWQEITGGMDIHGEAIWVPGAGTLTGGGYTATNFCAAPGTYGFGGGRLAMVQYGYSGPFPGSYPGPAPYDLDFAC